MEKNFLSSREVSNLLGISQNALAMRVRRKKFPAPVVRKPRGKTVRLFWEAAAVEAYLRGRALFIEAMKGAQNAGE